MTTATMLYAQFNRMMSEELSCLLEKLKADKRTKDPIEYTSLIEYTRDEHGIFHVKLKKPEQQENNVVEWHDLEKNPDDLPNENMKQVIVMDCRDNYLMGWYCIHRKTWYDNECPDEFDDKIKDVVKWKEIE